MWLRCRSTVSGFIVAFAATAVAYVARRFFLADFLGSDAPLYLFLFAVMAAAGCGGLQPGIVATALGALCGTYFFVEQTHWRLSHPSDQIRIGMFLAAGAIISWFCESMHKSRERSEQKREALRTTLHSIGDAVITTDINGRITTLNPVAEQLTGWTRPEAEGRGLDEIF